MNKIFSRDESKEDYLEFMKGAVAAFAPGRIEFLGNHLDYNGGTVLGTAINAGIYGLALPMEGTEFRLFSESFEGAEIYGSIQKLEKQTGKQSWGNYCLGVLQVLQDRGLAPNHGFSLILTTDLPMSAGLSSSAAVEVATAMCLLQLANQKITKNELVNICRQAENDFVGLPCGILDQGTSTFGKTNQVVQIDCAKEEYSTHPLPSDTRLWIFDTGIKHDLVDSHYGTRHKECTEALKILKLSNPKIQTLAECQSEILVDSNLPKKIMKRASHVVDEQKRVLKFIDELDKSTSPDKLGSILTESHYSSSKNFENSIPQLDFLVSELIKEKDVLGARLTGGGFGGAVLAWTTSNFCKQRASHISQVYERKWKQEAKFHFFKPSKGASTVDPLHVPKN